MTSKALKKKSLKAVNTTFCWFLALIWFLPFLGLVMASVRPGDELINGWWMLDNFSFSMKNYTDVLFTASIPLARPMLNSLIIALLGSVLPIFFGFSGGYAFARHYIPWKKTIMVILLSIMAIPLQMISVPIFKMMNAMHLLDTIWSLTILNTATAIPWIIFFIMNFILAQPLEVEEAAKIDGCSTFQILRNIVLPQTWPAFISVFVLQFVWCWVDFFLPLLFLYSPEKYTAVQVIPMLRGQFVTDWGRLSAASVLVTSVPLGVFLLLQKYYIASSVGWVPDK